MLSATPKREPTPTNTKMKTIRTVPEKLIVHRDIAEHISQFKLKSFTALTDGDFALEKRIRLQNNEIKIQSINWDENLANKLEPMDENHSIFCGDINNVSGPWNNIKGAKGFWFDYCSLVQPWGGFFNACSEIPSLEVVFVTFSAFKRGLARSEWPKQNLGIASRELSAGTLAFQIIKATHREMRKIGFIPFYSVDYVPNGAGRMVTVGFRRKNSTDKPFAVGSTKIKSLSVKKQKQKNNVRTVSGWSCQYLLDFSKCKSLKSLKHFDFGKMNPGQKATLVRRANALQLPVEKLIKILKEQAG